jgi:stage V sporulation protein AE
MDYVKAFFVGGFICLIGQILMDKTKITPGRILVIFVTSGVILGGLGIYEPIIKYGGAGASIPLPGFGYALAKGAIMDVDKIGIIGAFTGGIKATAAGITAAIFFGYLASILFKAKAKS